MMLNKIGREIPNKVQGFGEIKPYNGPFAEVKKIGRASCRERV